MAGVDQGGDPIAGGVDQAIQRGRDVASQALEAARQAQAGGGLHGTHLAGLVGHSSRAPSHATPHGTSGHESPHDQHAARAHAGTQHSTVQAPMARAHGGSDAALAAHHAAAGKGVHESYHQYARHNPHTTAAAMAPRAPTVLHRATAAVGRVVDRVAAHSARAQALTPQHPVGPVHAPPHAPAPSRGGSASAHTPRVAPTVRVRAGSTSSSSSAPHAHAPPHVASTPHAPPHGPAAHHGGYTPVDPHHAARMAEHRAKMAEAGLHTGKHGGVYRIGANGRKVYVR